MNCHSGGNGSGNKRMWLVVLLVAVLAIGLWAAFGRGGLIGLLPFLGLILCPIIHGAMFLVLGRSMMQGSKYQNHGQSIETNLKETN